MHSLNLATLNRKQTKAPNTITGISEANRLLIQLLLEACPYSIAIMNPESPDSKRAVQAIGKEAGNEMTPAVVEKTIETEGNRMTAELLITGETKAVEECTSMMNTAQGQATRSKNQTWAVDTTEAATKRTSSQDSTTMMTRRVLPSMKPCRRTNPCCDEGRVFFQPAAWLLIINSLLVNSFWSKSLANLMAAGWLAQYS